MTLSLATMRIILLRSGNNSAADLDALHHDLAVGGALASDPNLVHRRTYDQSNLEEVTAMEELARKIRIYVDVYSDLAT